MTEHIQIGLLATTFIHVGEGQNPGSTDLPFAREGGSQAPFIPASSIKGALRADFRDDPERDEIFGPEPGDNTSDPQENPSERPSQKSAAAIFGDAVLVALPIRSNDLPYLHVTCPMQLRRYNIQLEMCGKKGIAIPPVSDVALCAADLGKKIKLEDLTMPAAGGASDLAIHLENLIPKTHSLEETLVLVNDRVFRWLSAHAMPKRARNRLGEDKIVEEGALWYEEYLPPDTVLSTLWGKRRMVRNDINPLEHVWNSQFIRFADDENCARFLQVGGNETVGQGWFQLTKVMQ